MLPPLIATGGDPMTEHTSSVSPLAPVSRRRINPLRIGVATILLVALLLVAGQLAIASIHPAGMGSVGAVNIVGGETCDDGSAGVSDCVVSDYAPGKAAALAFSIRNNGPITMTVDSVDPIGADLVPLVAFYPALPSDGQIISWTDTRPFTPIEIRAGEDAAILMIGFMSDDCETVAANWTADSGLIIDHALLTVRWGLVGSTVNLPFLSAMEVRIPHGGACAGA
jgi:hypothetical protein